MASVPDPSGPGDLPAFDPSQSDNYMGNVMSAYNNGYTYDNLVDHHLANDIPTTPPRPSLDAIASGNPITADDLQLDSANKVKDQIVQMAESGAGVGALENVGASVVKYAAAAFAGASTMRLFQGFANDPNIFGNDFKSQQELVLRGMANDQNRELARRRNNGG